MDLKGRTAVISGGTSGIGRATALMLASQGAEVIILGRDATRGAETEAALKAASGGKGAFIKADFSLISDTRRVVAQISQRLDKLDALIQSVGGVEFEAQTTSEGLNKLFVANFLHRLVMAEGLKPLLAKAQGRLVMVSADLSDKQEPDWANFEGAQSYAGIPSLPRMHTACQAVAQGLAKDWKADNIEITAIHPGLVDTGFFRTATGIYRLVAGIIKLFVVPPDRPAALLSWLAFSPEAKGLSGCFFPSIKDFSKHRVLNRSQQTLDRVFKVARAALAKVPA